MAAKKYNEIEVQESTITETSETETVIKKEMKSVVTTEPKKIKRGLMGRFVNGIIGPDGASGIGEYVNEEIIKPAIKNIIVDAVTSGINMIMYGEKGSSSRGGYRPGVGYNRNRDSGNNNRVNYSSRSSRRDEQPRQRSSRYGIEEYIIEDRYEASHVLTALTEAADMYDSVSVADYYDLISITPQFTDNQYGWTIDTIGRATIIPTRGGYVIKFPPVEVI